MGSMVFRFVIGAIVINLFAALGDILRPKSFAGLFGAAPSVALATLGLTIHQHGKQYAAIECRSMIAGATAFLCYAFLASLVLRRFRASALTATISLMPVWFCVSFGLLLLFEKHT